jgi:hypothetical protein
MIRIWIPIIMSPKGSEFGDKPLKKGIIKIYFVLRFY